MVKVIAGSISCPEKTLKVSVEKIKWINKQLALRPEQTASTFASTSIQFC